MGNTLIGSFYFKKTNNGNLVGEFANNSSEAITTESANELALTKTFIGNYDSTWHDNSTHFAKLYIHLREKDNDRIFALDWEENGVQTYKGEGFLLDKETLIGFYTRID